jgi:hypothetical protein
MGISAIGKHENFKAYQEKCGGYPLYSKSKKRLSGVPIHHKENKELVYSLEDVLSKIKAGTHHMRLIGQDSKAKNVFSPQSISIN